MMERMEGPENRPQGRRKMGYRERLAVLAAVLATLTASALAYQSEPGIHTDPKSGIEVHVQIPFGEQPHSGFFPVHLQIHNDTDSGHTWDLNFNSNDSIMGSRFRTAVAVGAHQRREFDVLVPWPGLDSVQPNYRTIVGSISGPGVIGGNFNFGSHYNSGAAMSMAAMAEPLGSIWTSVETKLKGGQSVPGGSHGLPLTRFRSGQPRNGPRVIHGSLVRLDELPADVRAFSGLGGLWVSEADWRSQPGARRNAIRQWVMEGGRLFIAAAPTTKLPGLPAIGSNPTPLGFGEIRSVEMKGTTVGVDDTATRLIELDSAPMPPWSEDYDENWKLRDTVGEPHLNVPLLIIFVVAFGVIVGPVNLLVFAPPARRYRLFFTVPLLSAAASVLLLALIAFGDGVGGDGARNVLLFVPAGENRLSLFQEQMVRTRLLFKRDFELPETVGASYIGITNSDARERGNISLSREGTTLGGDWFRTRAVQGLFLRTSIPSRGEVVLRPGATPELLSTLASTLRGVHYVDAAGKYWMIDELSTGRPGKLRAATHEEFVAWREQVAKSLSHSLRAQFESTLWRPGYFYAEAAPSDENTIPTLRSIRWNEQHVICLGPCTGEAAP